MKIVNIRLSQIFDFTSWRIKGYSEPPRGETKVIMPSDGHNLPGALSLAAYGRIFQSLTIHALPMTENIFTTTQIWAAVGFIYSVAQ